MGEKATTSLEKQQTSKSHFQGDSNGCFVESYSISHLPHDERPRERLMKYGPEALSAAELIAIVLGSGTKDAPVLQLAQKMIAHFGGLHGLAEATVPELCQVKGIGPIKAIQLCAIFNLSSRLSKAVISPKYKIERPLHVYNLVKDDLGKEKREVFVIIMLDVKGCVIAQQIISIGTLTQAPVHPREVFYPAIRHKAASIILLHNHPSGDLTPSKQDVELTKQLIEAGRLIGIPVHDHLIISEQGYYSLRQQGGLF